MDAAVELVKFSVTDAVVAEVRERCMAMRVTGPDDEQGFAVVHEARMQVKGKRVEVEKRRVELKADALKYGRLVDAEARRITAMLEPIEEHLAEQERIVTDEKERCRKAAEEAERLKLEAAAKAIRDAEEAKTRAEREAEEKRLQEERGKLAKEREAMEAERRKTEAAQKAERDRLAAIEAKQRAEAERIEAENRHIEMEKAKAKAAEQSRIETEQRLKREAEEKTRREAEQKAKAEEDRLRQEEMRPDVAKVKAYGKALLAVEVPQPKSLEATRFVDGIRAAVAELSKKCGRFSAKGEA